MQISELKEAILLFIAIISALSGLVVWFKKFKKDIFAAVREPIITRLDITDAKILSAKREAVRATITAMISKGKLDDSVNQRDLLKAYELYLDLGGNFTMSSQMEQAFAQAGQGAILKKFLRNRRAGIRIEERNQLFATNQEKEE